MSKTNDTSKLDHAKLENRVLADSELDAVSGGARTDPGDDDDKMSGGELSALIILGGPDTRPGVRSK